MMKHIIVLTSIILSNQLFDLTPSVGISGYFNVKNIGLALILLFLFYALLKSLDRLERINTPLSWLVISLLAYEVIQVSIASIRYDQAIINGFIGAKDMGHLLIYFIVLLLYKDERDIETIMKILTVTAVILGFLVIINYFGFNILYFKKDRDIAIRSGIMRAHVPAISLFVSTCLWSVAKLMGKKKLKTIWFPAAIFLYGILVFSQARMYMISSAAAVLSGLYLYKKYKLLAGVIITAMICISILSLSLETNPLTNNFKSAVTDVIDTSGTWKGRAEQVKQSWQVFKDNMWTGSGASALRVSITEGRQRQFVHQQHYGADLGYMHLLKFYGIPFILWFLFLIILVFRYGKKILQMDPDFRAIALCRYSIMYFVYFFISMITMDHIRIHCRTVMFAISLAVFQICFLLIRHEPESSGLIKHEDT